MSIIHVSGGLADGVLCDAVAMFVRISNGRGTIAYRWGNITTDLLSHARSIRFYVWKSICPCHGTRYRDASSSIGSTRRLLYCDAMATVVSRIGGEYHYCEQMMPWACSAFILRLSACPRHVKRVPTKIMSTIYSSIGSTSRLCDGVHRRPRSHLVGHRGGQHPDC